MKTLHTDPGHGWLEVTRAELAELGILHKVSAYSYQRGGEVYLEEDCDAALYFDAYRRKHGAEPDCKVVNTNQDHPIRSFQRFGA